MTNAEIEPGRLAGRVALVTGSSRGIGASIAEALAAEGAIVAVHGRDEDAAGLVRDRIRATGGRASAFTADVTELVQLERMRARIEDELGPVDILVANAGGNPVPPGAIENLTVDNWRLSIDANLTATFLTIKCFLPGMKERGAGCLVTLSSAAARRPTANSPVAYAAAKAGIEALTQYVAVQAGPFGVRANCIAPETILTDRTRSQIPAEVQKTLVASHPIRRLGEPLDIARAVVYLVSQDSAWVTGVVLDIAGGSVLR